MRDPHGPLLAASVRGLGAKLQQHVGGDQEWTLSCARLELTNTRVGADGRGLSRLLWSEDARKNFPSAVHLADAEKKPRADAAPQFNLVYSTEGAIECWGPPVSSNTNGVATDIPDGLYSEVHVVLSHICALTQDDKVDCWGNYSNSDGQLDVPAFIKGSGN